MKIRSVKKKGSTIVELIAAIAILVIGLEGISMAFSTSTKTWQNHGKKLDTSTFNQTICQNLRQKEKRDIRDYYEDNIVTLPATVNIFIYFDSYDDLVAAVADETGYVAPSSPSTDDFAQCKLQNSGGKNYGALISVTDDRIIDLAHPLDPSKNDYYALYRFDIKVWNLKDNGSYEAVSTFYIGG